MSVRLCYVSYVGLCYILCVLQHFVYGGCFYPDTVYNAINYRYLLTINSRWANVLTTSPSAQWMIISINVTTLLLWLYLWNKNSTVNNGCYSFNVFTASFFAVYSYFFHKSFLHSHSYCFQTAFADLNLYCIKGALSFVCFSFFFFIFFSGYVC